MWKNILITSAGKRVLLTKFFIKELKTIYPDAKVITVDSNPTYAPAALISDQYFCVPKVLSDKYINTLLDICIHNQIRLVIPTIDTELLVLANNKALFEEHGIIVVVSDLSFIEQCRDKRKTNNLFDKFRIRFPKPIDKLNPTFPLFAKPYDGSCSVNLHIIKKKDELTKEILNDSRLIFMEYIDKQLYKEYTVDMYFGKDNKLKSVVPRERIEIRSGEINKGQTHKNYLMHYFKENMCYIDGVIGCICVQVFYNEKNNDIVGIEINPRFGGGYTMSYHSGANYIKNLIDEYLLMNDIDYSEDWVDNTLVLRYDDEVVFHLS